MNIIGQIDPSAFASAQRLHHRLDEPALEFPSSASSRRRGLLALRAMNWRASGGPTPPPWEPTENAYVETDGVCYIDTGWTPTPTGAYSTDIRAIYAASSGIIGCLNPTASCRMGLSANSRAMYYGQSSYTIAMTNGPVMTDRAVRAVDNLNNTIQNGTDVRAIPGNNIANMKTFIIGGRNYTTVDNKGAWRLWNFKGWQDGALVCDYYPREIDGVAGLWDMVTQTFLAPIGGTLSYGISAT